jgi:hypothetical protein
MSNCWCCDRRSFGLSVLMSGTPLGHMTRFFFFISFAGQFSLLFDLGRPLWRENRSIICSAICQWSESWRTRNHALLSPLRLLGSLSVASYDSQGLRWKYSYPLPHGRMKFKISNDASTLQEFEFTGFNIGFSSNWTFQLENQEYTTNMNSH